MSEKGTVALSSFLNTLNLYCSCLYNEIGQSLPKSVHNIRKHFRREHSLDEFVVCPKCCHLYNISECIIRKRGCEESVKCILMLILLMHHSIHSMQTPVLMKCVKVGSSFKLVPCKACFYRDLVSPLVNMARRPGFLHKCDDWTTNSDCVVTYICA